MSNLFEFSVFAGDDHLLFFQDQLITREHHHAFLHLIVSLSPKQCVPLKLNIQEEVVPTQALLMGSHLKHQFVSTLHPHAVLLIDHTSNIGRALKSHYLETPLHYYQFSQQEAGQLATTCLQIKTDVHQPQDYQLYWEKLLAQLNITSCYNSHQVFENRILRAIEYIEAEKLYAIPLKQIAEKVHLSPSHFSHLFKAYTGSTLKHFLLFKQLIHALTFIAEGLSVTEAALNAGFDTPSHLSTCCKKLVGLQPRVINQVSRFLKVSKFH